MSFTNMFCHFLLGLGLSVAIGAEKIEFWAILGMIFLIEYLDRKEERK